MSELNKELNLESGQFTTETDNLNIFKKMFEVMKEVNCIDKDGTNDYHNYDYVKEEDVVKEMKKQLIKQRVHYNSTVIAERSEGNSRKALVRFILTDLDSGEQFISQYWGEGKDKGDKGYYKAYAGATKYFFMKNFLLAGGDDPEADVSTDRNAYGDSSNKKSRDNNYSTKNSGGNSKNNSNNSSGGGDNSELVETIKTKMKETNSEDVANKFLSMIGKDDISELGQGELQALKNKLS